MAIPFRLFKRCIAIFTLLLVPYLSFAQDAQVDWSGAWDSRWRDGGAKIVFEQNGARVSGTYPLFDGVIEARAHGKTLQGRWIQPKDSGTFIFVQSRDGRSFTGRFDSGEWWTGVRSDAISAQLRRFDQSSPRAVMRAFLTETNLARSDDMEMLGRVASLIYLDNDPDGEKDRLEYARRLLEVIGHITLRIWDLPRDSVDDRVTVDLQQAGTENRFLLAFAREQDRWFIMPPPVSEMETTRDRMRIARGLPQGRGQPADLNALGSPRDTMRAFLEGFQVAGDGTASQTRDTLDLRDVPEVARDREAPILAGYLKLVLDRVGFVLFEEIPDDPESRIIYTHLEHPEGNIVIAPVKSEDGTLVWQFTPATLTRIRAIYAAMDDMPLAPGLTDLSGLGWHFTIRRTIRDSFPALLQPLGPLERWQWLGLVVGVIFTILSALAVSNLAMKGIGWMNWVDRTNAPFGFLLALWGWRSLIAGSLILWLNTVLGLTRDFTGALSTLAWLLAVLGGTIVIWQIIGWMAERSTTSGRLSGHNATLMSQGTGMVRILLLIGSGFLLSYVFSLPLAGVVAGLGIGGLAFALAAQPTLQNLLAGVTLYADRPVAIGDFCRFGDTMGTVEHIGMRSTRLRTLDQTVISVPNAQFLDLQLENYALRNRRLFETVLQLRYETTPDQLRYVLADLRKLLLAHPMVLSDPMRVRFTGFGAHSLDIDVFAYVLTADTDAYQAVREDVLLRIMEVVDAAGAQFAFPAFVEYHAEDTPADAERTARAEAAVAEWRARDDLPFPDFEWQTKAELSSSLDWPPAGSAVRTKTP